MNEIQCSDCGYKYELDTTDIYDQDTWYEEECLECENVIRVEVYEKTLKSK